MEDLKFRVWHKVEKRYLPLTEGTGSDYRVLTIDAATGNVSMFNVYGLERPVNYAKEDCVIEQYVGQKDMEGNLIYEGDVNQDGGILVWNEEDCSYCWDYPNIEMMSVGSESSWCKIVGNISQNQVK